MSLKDLKQNRLSSREKLLEQVSRLDNKKPQRETDSRFWRLKQDAAGNGSAVIRFLPAADGEDFPFVTAYTHSFKGRTGKFLIEPCLKTINQKCPICDASWALWNTQIEENQNFAKPMIKTAQYISNIFVVSDQAAPENEGKVFLFKYGKTVYDKIKELMYPQDDTEEAVIPFDLWEGANFKIRVHKQGNFNKYDKSVFGRVSPLSTDDSVLEEVYSQERQLFEFIDPTTFKTAADLEKRFLSVQGEVVEEAKEEVDSSLELLKQKAKSAIKPVRRNLEDEDPEPKATIKTVSSINQTSQETDDENITDYLNSLSEDD